MADILHIASTRGPDDAPVCELTWGPERWYAPVADVRQAAMDLMTCAAYAEMMREMVVVAEIPVKTVEAFTTSLLHDAGPAHAFGTPATVEVMPASGVHRPTGKRRAVVLLSRGRLDGMVHADEARKMARDWMAAAEATESDQLVAEALRAVLPGNDAVAPRLFGYLRKLRDHA